MARSMEAFAKQPGWKPETRYSNNVLMGNWFESRLQFEKGSHPGSTSTYRTEFQTHDGGQLDRHSCTSGRMDGVLRNDGNGTPLLFHHHGKAFLTGQTISTYDQEYCRRQQSRLRSWDRHQSAWRPEKSDWPIQGAATQTGLLGTLQAKWKKEADLEAHGDFTTRHTLDFKTPPASSLATQHYATPYALSSHLQPQNIINKNLSFRGAPFMLAPERFQLPEKPASHSQVPGVTN